MKSLSACFIFIIVSNLVYSQDNTETTIVYEFTMPALITKCPDINGTTAKDSCGNPIQEQVPPSYIFYLNGSTDKREAIIQFRQFSDEKINARYVYTDSIMKYYRKK